MYGHKKCPCKPASFFVHSLGGGGGGGGRRRSFILQPERKKTGFLNIRRSLVACRIGGGSGAREEG